MRLFAIAAVLLLAALPARAEIFEVRMLNGNATGGMAFEPDFLSLKPGDRVRFRATQRGHNAASIEGFLPAGATPFKGRINEEIEVTFTGEGFYGVKCTPHFDMGMVMLIRVGGAQLSSMRMPEGLPPGAQDRFRAIAGRAGGR